MATETFAQGLAKACKQYGTVLICDEIQCGYGRTGRFFAHQWLGIRPDLITCAKGIANGLPMGAVLISPDFEAINGQLGTTFGGNHLACAAALAVLDVIEDERLIENAATVGDYLLKQLKAVPQLHDVRGRGLMIGFDVARPAADLRRRLIFDDHIFTGGAGANTVRLLPPLCLSKAEADRFLTAITQEVCPSVPPTGLKQ